MQRSVPGGAHDTRGFIQVSGAWYLDTLPTVLREADFAICARMVN